MQSPIGDVFGSGTRRHSSGYNEANFSQPKISEARRLAHMCHRFECGAKDESEHIVFRSTCRAHLVKDEGGLQSVLQSIRKHTF